MRWFFRKLYSYFSFKRYSVLSSLGFHRKSVLLHGLDLSVYIREGKEPALVLVHGFLDASFGFRKLIPHLPADRKIVLIDVPSFGKSRLPEIRYLYRMDVYAGLIYEIFQKLDLRGFILSGHSMGGLLSQHLAILDRKKDRRISRLILISPGSERHNERDEVRKILFPKTRTDLNTLLSNLYQKDTPEVSAFVSMILLSEWGRKEYEWLAENTIADEKEVFLGVQARKIRLPVLIISAKNDRITPPASLKKLHRWIHGSRLVFLPEGRHAIHLEFPEQVAEIMMKYSLNKNE